MWNKSWNTNVQTSTVHDIVKLNVPLNLCIWNTEFILLMCTVCVQYFEISVCHFWRESRKRKDKCWEMTVCARNMRKQQMIKESNQQWLYHIFKHCMNLLRSCRSSFLPTVQGHNVLSFPYNPLFFGSHILEYFAVIVRGTEHLSVKIYVLLLLSWFR
jgi:hypothetical protein